ncbi:MAG: excalibur calcium-binding domain-containing protein [Gordonia sp. (in: high G+C Gram-positive bacteria)]
MTTPFPDLGGPAQPSRNRKPLLIAGGVVVAIILMCGSCGIGTVIGGGTNAAPTATTTVTRLSTVTVTPSTSTSRTASRTSRTSPVRSTQTQGLLPPRPAQDDDSTRTRTTTTTQDPAGGGAAYYGSCADARAAGQAPLHRGEPGYRSGLDRDGDGIACDTTG